MGREMPVDRKEYLKEYKKKNLKRIPLEVDYDFYIRLQQAAALAGRSVNGFIKEAVLSRIKASESEQAIDAAEEKTRSFREKLLALSGEANTER